MSQSVDMLGFAIVKILKQGEDCTLDVITTLFKTHKFTFSTNKILSSINKLIHYGVVKQVNGLYTLNRNGPKIEVLACNINTEFLECFGTNRLIKHRLNYITKYYKPEEVNSYKQQQIALEMNYLTQLRCKAV